MLILPLLASQTLSGLLAASAVYWSGWPRPRLLARGCSLRRQLEERPSKQWGILMPGDPNWRICVLWEKYKHLPDRQLILDRDPFVVCRGGLFTFSSVQFSCSVVSNSLQPHELQHTRPPCPSPSPGVHSDSCPLSQ